jgi:hypothetical protein
MNRWFHTVALAGLLTPLALCGDRDESTRPPTQKGSPRGCCTAKTENVDVSAGKSAGVQCAVPEDERQAYLDLMEIIRTTDSPDTFTAAVTGLLGADGAAEKRYARLAVPVVIRNAERLGLLKGIASAEQITPAQAELRDYLVGALPEPPQGDQAVAESYGAPSGWWSNPATGTYSSMPTPMPLVWPYASCPTAPPPQPTIPAAAPEPVAPAMKRAVEGPSEPATAPAAVTPTPPGAAPPKDSPPASTGESCAPKKTGNGNENTVEEK